MDGQIQDGRLGGGRPCSGRKDECPLLSLRPSLPLIHRGRGWSRWSRSALSFPTDDHTCGLEGDTRGSVFFLISLERPAPSPSPPFTFTVCPSLLKRHSVWLADRNSTRWSSQGRLFYVLFFPPRPSSSRSPLTPPPNGHRLPLVLPPDPSPSPSVVGASAPHVGTQIFPPKAA